MANEFRDKARSMVFGVPLDPAKQPEKDVFLEFAELIDAAKASLEGKVQGAVEIADNAMALAVAGAKAPVPVRTVLAGSASITSGLENGDTPAGSGLATPLATGDWVVITGHGTPSQNGVYEVQASGQAPRASGFETSLGLHRASFFSMDGATAGQVWAVRNETAPVVGTDAIAITRAYEVAGVQVADENEALVGESPKLMSAERSASTTVDLSRSTDLELRYTGSGPVEPLAITVTDGVVRVLLGVERATGRVVGFFGDQGGTGGGGDDGGSTVHHSAALGYVEEGVLRAIGGSAGDRVLDNNGARTWLSAQAEMGNVLAIYEDSEDARHLVRLGAESGDLYAAGEWTVITEDGQSNGEGQAGSSAEAVVTDARYGSQVLMLGTSIWSATGQTTSGGNSNELDGNAIGEFAPLRDTLGTATHGTTALAGLLRAEAAAAMAECGWLPKLVGWNNAEGGQSIGNLLPDPPPGNYAFANAITRMERALALLPAGQRLVYRWMIMAQGEANAGSATLGAQHEAYRAAMEAEAQSIFGQAERLRMITFQPSSFYSGSHTGVQSLLDYHLSEVEPFGAYWCGGPTYFCPWSSDYLHHTSIGHLMRGEYARQIMKLVEKTGSFAPLHMVSAAVTGTNEITVTLSEPAVIDNNWLVAPIENAGITVPDRTVTGVAVSGATMTITTAEAAAGATAVYAALSGHSGSRTPATIPRSTIRSLAASELGRFSSDCGLYAGIRMYRPLCHQRLAIS